MKQPRNLILSPNAKTSVGESKTIGYMAGSFPHIVVRLNGDPFELKMGQCIPCAGEFVSVENPFERTGTAQIVQDAPVNLNCSPVAQTGGIHTYRGRFSFKIANADPGDQYQGFGLMMTRGRARVTVMTEANLQYRFYTRANPEFMAVKPSSGMKETLELFHPTGDDLSACCVGISGSYSDTFIDDWVAASSYDLNNRFDVQKGTSGGGEFFIEPGMALWCHTLSLQDGHIGLVVDHMGVSGLIGV